MTRRLVNIMDMPDPTGESGIEPCPHGHEQRSLGMVVVPVAEGNAPRWYVRCMDCSATGPRTGTRETAIAAWNRRHPPASREEGLNEDDWQALLSAVENLRGGGNRDEPTATDTRWRIASNLADIAERLRAALIPTKPEAKEPHWAARNEPDYADPVRPPGAYAALQSKKPE